MPDKAKVVVYGVGNMGKLITRYLHEKNFGIVGAVNRTSNIGEDLGQVAELGLDLGVTISGSAEEIYQHNDADIAIVSTTSDMESLVALARDILPRGVNILTLTDQAFWPWRHAPEISEELDSMARENNVTISASGMQDPCLLNMISALSGACNRIESMRVQTNSNLDFYGSAVLDHYLIGLSEAEYNSEAQNMEPAPPIFGFAVEALAADLELTISSWNCHYTPVFAETPVESMSLARTIDKGLSIGHTECLDVETEEGISIQTRFIQEIAPPDKGSELSWEVTGEPDINLVIDRLDGEAVTCASIVNRIPDVVNAKPGFITCENLPRLKFH